MIRFYYKCPNCKKRPRDEPAPLAHGVPAGSRMVYCCGFMACKATRIESLCAWNTLIETALARRAVLSGG